MATTPRAVRLGDDELAFIRALLPHFPELRNEADVQYQATLLGLWLLATAARRPGLIAFGGYDPADLAALLRPRLLAALEFLAEQGTWLRVVQAQAVVAVEPAAIWEPVAPGRGVPLPAPHLVAEAAAGLADFGSDFLD